MFYVIGSAPAHGFDGVFRAGRKWPVGGTRVAFSKKNRADANVPEIVECTDESGRAYFSVDAQSETLIREDKRLSLMIEGSGEDEIITLRRRVAELEAMVESLTRPTEPVAKAEQKHGKK